MTSIRQAAATLATAGVASPLNDARILAAHVLGCEPMELILHDQEALPLLFEELVQRRAQREPLQHILGTAPMGHLDLQVGPGVFVPRPETELVGAWTVERLRGMGVEKPRVVDLCTGSGTLACYIASLIPEAQVTAVELDEAARQWALKNVADLGLGVTVVAGDATDPQLLPDLQGTADAVVSNPPYVPEGTPIEPEVQADPHHAVFSGGTGMDVIEKMVPIAARMLRVGGVLSIEHDDSTADLVCAVLAQQHCFGEITSHQDFAGRDRYVTAVKTSE
ncbi:Release factor glutamine methyltransferase [Corynebacterium kalinowskii]|uniref:Release factor glutamine methyltransferase n=1 Tax=Corynebacterium kalinowskii TaxID=2675216 RepID=A0A6B8VSS1_9CORY|nr:peptide chain release factor N(5)-glutamine methyltransferase [Corynebacterium kalinowskii]QGU01776.1 Release factor glutamine methyltransferase [Corynebacterium kalinowskii]